MATDPAGPQDPRAENCRAVAVDGAGKVIGAPVEQVETLVWDDRVSVSPF